MITVYICGTCSKPSGLAITASATNSTSLFGGLKSFVPGMKFFLYSL